MEKKLYSKIATALFFCFAIPSQGFAEETKAIEVIDFLVDAEGLIGKTVTVTGCQFTAATTHGVLCSAGMPGNFTIEGKSLDKEDLRRALKTCSSFGDNPACIGSVTGTVRKGSFGIQLEKSKIKWNAT